MEKIIETTNPVYTFQEVVGHIDLNKYFAGKDCKTGHPRYDREKLLKVVLFAFFGAWISLTSENREAV